MKVYLIGKNIMYKLNLPQTVEGNYWLTDDKDRKLINIEGLDKEWQVINDNYLDIFDFNIIDVNNDNIKLDINKAERRNTIPLKEYQTYGIVFKNLEELFILYCEPTFEEKITELNIKNVNEITIGNGVNNLISYSNKMVSNKHAKIYLYEGRWMIENYDNKFGTFLNGKPVTDKQTMLFNGDVIFIMGLKIIIMGRKIFVNTPKYVLHLSSGAFEESSNNQQVLNNIPEDDNQELYDEKDYFSRAPRLMNIIETEKVKIDSPPHIQDKEEMPLILTIGSSLSMGIIMMVSIFSAIDGRMSGTASSKQTITSLITAGAMLISMILFPILMAKYNRRKKKRYEERRQKKYREYLNKKNDQINKMKTKQKNILFENFLAPEECTQVILTRGARLWERKIDDYDFLTIRLGLGDVPLKIDINYPEEQFTMDDDDLLEVLNRIIDNSKTINSAPITISLTDKNILALITNNGNSTNRFIQSLIIQLVTFQSYEDLKLVFLLNNKSEETLNYVKMLPHVWSDNKQIRFFTDDYDEMNEISKYLEEILTERKRNDKKDYKSYMPYYLIITDDYKKIENLKIITEILKQSTNVGFSILCMTDDMMQLPNECKTFISIDNDLNTGTIFENELSTSNQQNFKFDSSVIFFFEKICQVLSNIPIKYSASSGKLLPNTYTFLEMYDVGRIEQLNILERWYRNDSTLSLKSPIGIDSSGMPIVLDIHEKFHGPHGLIAGSTGSGKSEFIITYVLSLATNYHPDDVNFILIDYKGGGLAGAFQKKNIKLPHLVGTITNIDTNGLKRSLVSIQSELRRRQVMFNEARDMTDEGTIDIYKYQRLYHQGIVKKPIPHLLIICDEFAELKQQQEEFMNELISVSRIGRSLGVHLILATQKPAGIVNEQIRSNSKFAVCLKVQDREDSMDVIKRPDAAMIKRVGEFFLQVGNDEYFVLGQSAWSGATYFPSNITEKKIDKSIEFISNIGTVIKQVNDESQKVLNSEGEQLTNIVRYMDKLANEKGIKEENLWLEDIPENIFLDNIKKKYKIKDRSEISAIIGEYDDPFNQRQGIVKLDFINSGNIIIYGNAESGKETLLSTMIYDIIDTYKDKQVELYVLDFGTEALKIYKDSPQVGDVIFIEEDEKIGRFFDMLQEEIKKRKEALLKYNGDYNLYLKNNDNSIPTMLIIMNNYDTFAEVYQDKYDDVLLTLTREATKCGIIFIVTANLFNSMRYRLSQNFKQRVALQLNVDNDYYNIFEKIGKKRPSNIFGRGLISIEEEIYEFQTAKICEEDDYNIFIKNKIEELNNSIKTHAKPIPVLPEVVKGKDLKRSFDGLSKIPIGIFEKNLKVCIYNFEKDFVNLITARDLETASQFTYNILEEIETSKELNVSIFDAERNNINNKTNIVEEYMAFVSNVDKNFSNKKCLCVIIGVNKFISKFENRLDFYNTLKALEEKGNIRMIFAESVLKFKGYEYEEWFKNYISKDNAIWVGNGITNQYLITINSNIRKLDNTCGESFGYIIKQGYAELVKLLGMKDVGDENE